MPASVARLVVGVVLTSIGAAAGGSAGLASSAADPAWVQVRSLATNYQFGELPTRAKQHVLGRVRIDRIARVSSVTIRGKKHTGDLLVIQGKYQNLESERSYWTEGYAFTFGTEPKLCTTTLCGVTPPGRWWHMTHAFGTPIVDYPASRFVPAHGTVVFREAIPLSSSSSGAVARNPTIRSLADIWLLPIYAAFNYYEQPFPRSQLVRLSDYFGRTSLPTG